MSQPVEKLVKSGHLTNLTNISTLMSESTTIAGIQMDILEEFGAIQLTQIRNGSTVQFQYVMQPTTVRKVTVQVILEA